jgi:hypothetical protein
VLLIKGQPFIPATSSWPLFHSIKTRRDEVGTGGALDTGGKRSVLLLQNSDLRVCSSAGLAVSSRHPYMFSAGDDKQVKCWDLEYNKVS